MSFRLRSHASLPLFTSFSLALSLLAACTDEGSTPDEVCDGAGHLHGDHCHCDTGFVLSPDGRHCLPKPSGGDSDSNSPDEGHSNDSDSDTSGSDSDSDSEPSVLTFVPDAVIAQVGLADDHTRFWLLEASTTQGLRLSLEHYETFGALTEPGTMALDPEESSYATCASCLILETGCESHNDHTHCERTFMPVPQGELRIEALGHEAGERIALTWQGLLFQEVTIAQDYSTTPIPGGQRILVPSLSLEASLLAFGPDEEVCGGHGHLHGSTCHCDAGYHLDPTDSTLCLADEGAP